MSTPRFPLDTTPHFGHTGLMKRLLKVLALWGCLACAALAEQRVIYVSVPSGTVFNPGLPDFASVTKLLREGWTVVRLTGGARGEVGGFVVFVLESPAPKEPVKP